jgi:hypothetical protein
VAMLTPSTKVQLRFVRSFYSVFLFGPG